MEGVLSHQLKQFIIDGNKCVLNKPGPEAKVDDQAFEENEVYGIDILVSTGDGKARVTDERETTVKSLLCCVPFKLPSHMHNFVQVVCTSCCLPGALSRGLCNGHA